MPAGGKRPLLRIHMTAEMYRAIVDAAHDAGLPVSDFARQALASAVRRQTGVSA